MKIRLLIASGLVAVLCISCHRMPVEKGHPKASGSFSSIGDWFDARTFPGRVLPVQTLIKAWQDKRTDNRNPYNLPNWTALGPDNIGGRTLCLAFSPEDPSVIYAGSASGGLWKTTTAGAGAAAWTRIPTGFPVLGVGAIAINPGDPQEIYIGTGEVYDYQDVGTGFTERTNRGTYGIGILKTTDGGLTWTKSLDWAYGDLRGVQDIDINPLNTHSLLAATTEGVYRSWDAGNSWQEVSDIRMAVDLERHPQDTSIVFVTFGSFESAESGIYRSTDGGQSFSELSSGLPASYTGKALLSIAPSNPSVIYASIADAFASKGLYKSTNGGDHWTLINNYDIAKYQGWYSHDVAVDPLNHNRLLNGGIDMSLSTDGGITLFQLTNWYEWYLGEVPAGGPEGPPDYVHADIHAIYFHPSAPQQVFVATDGGVFYSSDGGQTYQGRNGGYQTQQFYANFSNSTTDPDFAIGGMQDNATAIFKGNSSWHRVIGGDGMCTAIHPVNDSIVFASTQNMGIRRSPNRGGYFTFSSPTQNFTENPGFNSPFEMSVADPNIMYAGGQRLYRSSNNGISWQNASGDMVDGGNPIVNIAISPFYPGRLLFSTFPKYNAQAKVFLSSNAGLTRIATTGLPNRIAMDFVFHPADSNIVYTALSGFGTAHVYKSVNGGASWFPSGDGLPDVPANSLLIDPEYPEHVYLSNDIGVFISKDGGITWEDYSMGLTDAVLGMHLSLSPAINKIRLATHGNGVYEGNLFNPDLNFLAPDSLYIGVYNRYDWPLDDVAFHLISADDTLSGLSEGGIAALDLPEVIPPTPVVPDMPFPNADQIEFPFSHYPYRIEASRNTSHVAGVTTFDLLTIQKHILTIEPFDDPYQYLAADVSNNGLVTGQDLVRIRRVILYLDTVFADVPSWQFYPRDYQFPDPDNPFDPIPLKEIYYHPFSPENPEKLEWTGIKSGDVNFSAQQLTGDEASRNEAGITLSVTLQKLPGGFEAWFTTESHVEMEGFQCGISVAGQAIQSVECLMAGRIGPEHWVYHPDKKVVLISWSDAAVLSCGPGQVLFGLFIQADELPMIALDNRFLQPEIYFESGWAPLSLRQTMDADACCRLIPNPVVGKAILQMDLEIAQELLLEIQDLHGKIVFRSALSGQMGRNEMEIDLSSLPPGHYSCLLQGSEGIKSWLFTKS